MFKTLLMLMTLWSVHALAIPCDCEVRIYAPTVGTHQIPATSFKTYRLEGYDSYKVKNQLRCRDACVDKFHEDLPTKTLSAMLLVYSQKLIDEGVLGYNCTGLSTYKYPVRVKASLGKLGLGNVEDRLEIVTHEQSCF